MVIALVIILLYFFFYQLKEKAYFYLYNLYVTIFGVFLCAKFGAAATSLIYHIVPLAMLMSIIPYIKRYMYYIIVYFIILSIYIIIKYIFWHIDILRMFMDLRIGLFASCLGLSMVENIRRQSFNVNIFVRGLYILFSTQIIIAVCQYLIPSVNVFFLVIDANADRDAYELSQFLNMDLITGTMISPSVFSGFLALSIFLLLTYEMRNHTMTIKKTIFLFSLLGVLFITGIRTPFIFVIVFTVIYIFIYNKNLFFTLAPVFIILIYLLFSYDFVDIDGAVGRMLQGFVQASTGLEGLSESTIGYSILLLPFFFQNPIFGISQYNTTISQLFFDGMSRSDVYLMYILCEYGLLGLLFFLFPFFRMRTLVQKGKSLFNGIKINKSILFLYVTLGICLSIVDEGIFHFTQVSMIITGIILCSYNKIAESKPLNQL